ncbi:putative ankyrin repeat protein RF_0580 isoform X2 [Leptopilina heterotoma]|uniref:putative ankyrin repeat protein RF_0580 isoform X2 n=2 Tax=Leptopilina heterotoma TaxID=63436 RepID=UPI001CA7CE81|nr:putative ankyrin repeat protein RF_0580 isoform X2 [Leptopilina heterotoma]
MNLIETNLIVQDEPAEEELMRLLQFAPIRKIRDLIMNYPSLDLHYPNKDLRTPLTIAIDRGDSQILALIIDKIPTDLDSTMTQSCGKSALMHASYFSGNLEILQILLKKGVDLYKRDIRGWNCLYYAIVGRKIENVEFLLKSGLNVNSEDELGRTPLMISVFLSTFDIFSLLLDHDADVHKQDKFGFTAIELAILRRNRDCVISLMKKGSDLRKVTPFSRNTILQLAQERMSDILPAVRSNKRSLKTLSLKENMKYNF